MVLNIGEAVLHGAVFAQATEAAMKNLGHNATGSGADTAQLVLITFVQGLLGLLLYAAVQPRWKPGVATAIRVGLVLWVLSALYSAIYISAGFAGLMPASVVWGPAAWELVLYPLATVVGSLIYRE